MYMTESSFSEEGFVLALDSMEYGSNLAEKVYSQGELSLQ